MNTRARPWGWTAFGLGLLMLLSSCALTWGGYDGEVGISAFPAFYEPYGYGYGGWGGGYAVGPGRGGGRRVGPNPGGPRAGAGFGGRGAPSLPGRSRGRGR